MSGESILTAFVALNTLVFIGLTLFKFLRWPTPVRPESLRRIFRVEAAIPKESHGEEVRSLASELPVNIRIIATGSAWLAATSVGVALIEFLDQRLIVPEVIAATLAIASLVLALNLRRRLVSETSAMWLWSALVGGFVTLLIVLAATSGESTRFGYALVIMAAYAVALIAYTPFWVSSLGMLAVLAVVIVMSSSEGGIQILIAGVTAVVAGAFIVGVRRDIDTRDMRHLVLSGTAGLKDPSTGAWTWVGLQSVAPTFMSVAELGGLHVRVKTVTLTHLMKRTDEFGSAYGEQIMTSLMTHLREDFGHQSVVARLRLDTAAVMYVAEAEVPLSMEVNSEHLELGRPLVGVDVREFSARDGDLLKSIGSALVLTSN